MDKNYKELSEEKGEENNLTYEKTTKNNIHPIVQKYNRLKTIVFLLLIILFIVLGVFIYKDKINRKAFETIKQNLEQKNKTILKQMNLLKEEIKQLKAENTILKSKDKERNHANYYNKSQIDYDNIIDTKKGDKFSINTKILKSEGDLELIEKQLYKSHPLFEGKKIKYTLLYRGSTDGDSSKIFHNKCDNIKGTLSIIKTDEGLIFGGYTEELWNDNSETYRNDKQAFCFSLDLKKIYVPRNGEYAIYPFNGYGPWFSGPVIGVYDNFFSYGGWTDYSDSYNYYKSEINNGKRLFGIFELEVYKVTFE